MNVMALHHHILTACDILLRRNFSINKKLLDEFHGKKKGYKQKPDKILAGLLCGTPLSAIRNNTT